MAYYQGTDCHVAEDSTLHSVTAMEYADACQPGDAGPEEIDVETVAAAAAAAGGDEMVARMASSSLMR